MTHSMQENSLRRVAILVASLDDAWSERILSGLSEEEAALVRRHVDGLTDVDPDEQQEVIAEFRRSVSQPKASVSDGVEIEASLLERIDHQNYSQVVSRGISTLDSISTADADSFVDMLSGESPQTVAVVLSRLDTDRAAEVLSKIPVDRQTEILNRLEQLGDADEHAVAIVEAQINHWIVIQRQRRERMAASKQVVERLMSRTSTSKDGIVVSGRLAKDGSAVSAGYGRTSTETGLRTIPPPVRYERMPAPVAAEETPPRNPFAHLTADECLVHLEQLPDELLLAALSRVESQVVRLALVGASDKLMKRVLRGLSRREARQFRQQFRDIGPTRLSDILAAQHELLYAAAQLN